MSAEDSADSDRCRACRVVAYLKRAPRPDFGDDWVGELLWDSDPQNERFVKVVFCRREEAAFVLSEALGWPLAPPLVSREGPHGEGSVQLFIEHDTSANFFTLRDDCLDKFAPVAMFDVLIHNADRKGGSCLHDGQGRIWAIDHGLTFNEFARRRTVMFEFNGEPYPEDLVARLAEVRPEMEPDRELGMQLARLIGEDEVALLAARADAMLESGRWPVLDPRINVPYPFV